MKKKKTSQIQKQYRFEEDTNSYLIEVLLDDYDDVYNEWDPSPFKRRFIEEEFNEFILTSAEDIPKNFNLIIVLYLPEGVKDIEKERAVNLAYENYYLYAIEKEEKGWNILWKKNIFYLIFSIILLGIAYIYLNETDVIVLNLIREGIFIGGWVFLWEFITNTFFIRREYQNRIKLFKRLYLSDIRFIYNIKK